MATSQSLYVVDTIAGFLSGTDSIDLSGIDADLGVDGNQAFTFIGSEAFSGAGQVRFQAGVLYASIDADADAEFMISLTGVGSLAAGDLVL